MEKFYIVTNTEVLAEVKRIKEAESGRRNLINRFFDEKGIDGESYYIGGSGSVGKPFLERSKGDISLHIKDTENNRIKFASQLKKDVLDYNMRSFKKSSKILKEFQDKCIKEEIIINNHDIRFGDYFNEFQYLGYSSMRFELNGKYYLYLSSSKVDSITPTCEGFEEIKGSEFYEAKEIVESK